MPTLVPVHPTALYESVFAFVLAGLLWAVRMRMAPVAVFGLYAVLSGVARLLVEEVRINKPVLLGMPHRSCGHCPWWQREPHCSSGREGGCRPIPWDRSRGRQNPVRCQGRVHPGEAWGRSPPASNARGSDVPHGTVLVVDDESKIRDLVRTYLERDGYQVFVADCGDEAVAVARRVAPDLVVLDLGLPDLPGEEVIRILRRSSDVPVVMLTARASEGDRVSGLRLGADDYVTKPFSPRELVARVEAVLRRTGGGGATNTTTYAKGRLAVDLESREVKLDGESVELTRTEFDLLVALASRPGRAWSRFELVNRVQGYDYDGYERTVDAHVKNLRRKLGEGPGNPVFVRTVPGVGYKFGPTADA